MAKSAFKDEVWRIRHDAHLIHHRIADFILHFDDRNHPNKLAALVKKYRRLMESADKVETSAEVQ